MVILDTDHMSLLEWENTPAAPQLERRLDRLPAEEIATTIVNFEEQVRGWMATLAKAKRLVEQIPVYDRLVGQLRIYCALKILSFDENAAVQFQALRKSKLRLGTMDLKIAAIALSRQATLLWPTAKVLLH